MYRLKIDFYTPSSHFLTEYKHHKGTVPVLILSLDHPKGDLPKSHRASATAASCLRISETSRWGGLETWALRQCDKAIQGLGSRWEATRTWELRSYCKYTCMYMYTICTLSTKAHQNTPDLDISAARPKAVRWRRCRASGGCLLQQVAGTVRDTCQVLW